MRKGWVIQLAWRNLWRNRRRTILQLLAVGGAMYMSTCFENMATGEYEELIRTGVRTGSGHVAVYRKGYRDTRRPRLSFSVHPWIDQVRRIEGVERVFPRLYFPALARSAWSNRNALLIGADPEDFQDHPFFKKAQCSGSCFPLSAGEAMVGKNLAEGLELRVNKKFVIVLQDFKGNITSLLVRVKGIVQTHAPEVDGQGVFVDRRWLATQLGVPDQVHELAILGTYGVNERRLQRAIASVNDPNLEVVTWKEAMPELRSGIMLDHANLILMLVLIFLIVGVGTVNVMMMSTFERVREWGTLRAMGMSRRIILTMVMLEGLFLGGIGVGIGGVLGVITTGILHRTGINLSFLVQGEQSFAGVVWEPIIRPRLSLQALVVYSVLVLGLTLVGSWFPARWVASLAPAEAMRRTG